MAACALAAAGWLAARCGFALVDAAAAARGREPQSSEVVASGRGCVRGFDRAPTRMLLLLTVRAAGEHVLHGRHGEPNGEPEQGGGVSERAEQHHRDPAGASGPTEGPDRGVGAPGGGPVPGKRLSEGAASAAPGRLQTTPAGEPWRAGGHQGEHHTRKVSYKWGCRGCRTFPSFTGQTQGSSHTPLQCLVHEMNSRFLYIINADLEGLWNLNPVSRSVQLNGQTPPDR